MMKKVSALILVAALLVTVSSLALANCKYSYCDAEIAGTRFTGFSDLITTTHQYGGFLGLFQGTCTVTTQYAYFETLCAAGHIQSTTSSVMFENHSSCGQ